MKAGSRTVRRPTVAIVAQHFPPEGAACANRVSFFAGALREHGFDVRVVTATPSYPLGRTFDGYRRRPWCTERVDGITVHRTWAYTHPDRSPGRRLLSYGTFAAGSLRWTPSVARADVVLFSSGPLFAGLLPVVAAALGRRPLVLDVRDLWPEKIWASGAARVPRAGVAALTAAERLLYGRASVVLGATQGLCEVLRDRVPRGTDVVLVRNTAQRPPGGFRPPRPAGARVVVVDAGTLGWVQDPGLLLRAFERLRARGVPADLVVAGWGPRAPEVARAVDALPGSRFLGALSRAALHEELARCDIGVVALAAARHNHLAVARRTFDYAAAGLAVVYAGDGEGADLLRAHGAGLVVPPGDADALAGAVSRLAVDRTLLARTKAASGRLIEGEFADAAVAERLVRTVASLCRPRVLG